MGVALGAPLVMARLSLLPEHQAQGGIGAGPISRGWRVRPWALGVK